MLQQVYGDNTMSRAHIIWVVEKVHRELWVDKKVRETFSIRDWCQRCVGKTGGD